MEVGPVLYNAIVHDMQQVGDVAARLIVDEVRKLKLTDIPGENVKTLTSIIFEYAKHLEGVCAVPPDMASIVTACFTKSSTLTFNIEQLAVKKLAAERKITWDEALTKLDREYKTLLGNHEWEAALPNQEVPSAQALKAEIKAEIMGELKRSDSGTTGTNGGNKNRTVICHKCKQPGHYQRDCPSKGKPTAGGSKNAGRGGGGSKNSSNPYRTKPSDSEPKTKKINGVDCSWCDRCGRWTSGDKRHLTSEHQTREELGKGSKPASILKKGVTYADSAKVGGALAMHFHGAGHV
jgi:hypothetical protein